MVFCLLLTSQLSGNSCYSFYCCIYSSHTGPYRIHISPYPFAVTADVYMNMHSYTYSYCITRSLEIKAGQLPPPGLNRTLIANVTGGVMPSLEQLEQRKIAIVKLLTSEVLVAEEVICPLIVAAGDAKSR